MVKLVLKHLKPYGAIFVIGSLAKLAEAILELFLPAFMGNIIDIGIKNADISYIFKMVGNLIFVSVLGVCSALICQYGAAVASQGMGTNLRRALIKHVSGFSYAEIDKFGAPTLINRIGSDTNNVQNTVAMTMRLATRAPSICIGAVFMSFRINAGLALLFLAIIPLLGLTFYILVKGTAKLYTLSQLFLDKIALIVREDMAGVRVIRAFSRKAEEKARFNKATEQLKDVSFFVQTLSALTSPVTSVIVNAAIVAILFLGASYIFEGKLAQGKIFALSSYATQILYAVTVVTNMIVIYTKSFASAKRINEVLATQTSVAFPKVTALNSKAETPAVVEFDTVGFSYNKKENVLNDVSFSLKKGETLGVVGVTGSGKTTLINLAQRFYDVSEGTVLLGGTDIRCFAKKDLTEKIAFVPQKSILFSGTIAENIRWGKKEASEQEVLEALETAQMFDFVSGLPEGINTVIQEGGKNFSGGQRQRIAIARALVKKAEIIIMDDSLSALDYKTDLRLRTALKKKFQQSCFIIVSQRISSVSGADKILVLSSCGEVCGIGSHADLLLNCEEYKAIYQTQFEGETGVANEK